MGDTLDTITKLIQSPPGQLAAGGVLAGIVWKFFERIEAVLTENTKLEIAIWLLGVKVGTKVERWPDTFARVFDRVFGERHLSWRCFYRSAIASLVIGSALFALSGNLFIVLPGKDIKTTAAFIAVVALMFNALPDYLSLLETRVVLRMMQRLSGVGVMLVLLAVDLLLTAVTPLLVFTLWLLMFDKLTGSGYSPMASVRQSIPMIWKWRTSMIYPAFFTSIWLWLYAGSGFLLKAARRFDVGFDWFNKHADIEKKPLQSIGLVAGALVAVGYWSAVIVSGVVK